MWYAFHIVYLYLLFVDVKKKKLIILVAFWFYELIRIPLYVYIAHCARNELIVPTKNTVISELVNKSMCPPTYKL